MKTLRIFLLVLIIIGLGLLATQKMWVPKVVDEILVLQGTPVVDDISTLAVVSSDDTQKLYSTGIMCKETGAYVVISKMQSGTVGTSMLVKFKTSAEQVIPCVYTVQAGDFQIKNGEADYLLAIANHFLILDRGTAPYPRGLIVYDVNNRAQIYTDTYSAPIVIQTDSISYWATTTQKPTTANCPELTEWTKNGLGAGIETHVSLDLTTLKKTDLNQTRCSARQ